MIDYFEQPKSSKNRDMGWCLITFIKDLVYFVEETISLV